ncbi:MAG: trigger factor [Cytophagales bacterium]|nr:trigger factor [Cytophagales bacterium]
MDITLEKKTSTEGFIKITLKEGDYQPQVEEKIKDYSKKANIKGFRPGKVPFSYIKKLYGKSIMVDEINQILSESLTKYIRENKINILGEPLPNQDKSKNIDWDNQKDFDFEYNIGMVEEFDYDLSSKVKVTAYDIDVEDKTITETVENLKLQYGTMTNPDASEEGDALFGTLAQGDFTKDLLIEIADIDKKLFKKFIGLKSGDSATFDLHKAFTDTHALSHMLGVSEDETKALSGDFEFTVKNVNRRVPAELNKDFFDRIFATGDINSEQEFLDKIASTIKDNYAKETKSFLDYTIQNKLVDSTKIDLPDEFLKKWLITSNEGKITEEDIEKEYDAYVKDLKWSLIRNKIIEDQEIKLESEDIIEKTRQIIREQFAHSGLGAQIEDNIDTFVDNYLKGDEGNNYQKVYNQTMVEKLMGVIKEKISISHKKVDLEKFKKLVSN